MATIISIALIFLIVIAESVANYAVIAQHHDTFQYLDPKHSKMEFKFQQAMSSLWHRSFGAMWLVLIALVLIVDFGSWKFVALFLWLRFTLFAWLINFLTNQNLFPRRLAYLSNNGIDKIQKVVSKRILEAWRKLIKSKSTKPINEIVENLIYAAKLIVTAGIIAYIIVTI